MNNDIPLPPLTDEQCKDLAREVDLDWHRGFQVCEPENRYAALCRAAILLDRQQRAAPSAEPAEWVKNVMEQAQVFASAWALVGGPFDDGNALETAKEARDELRAMLAAAPPAPSAEPVSLNDPAVQKRLAAQWGYVSAPSAEPALPALWVIRATYVTGTVYAVEVNGWPVFSAGSHEVAQQMAHILARLPAPSGEKKA